MRVIAGEAKGQHLASPRNSATRPTTELVRGAIFSMLEAMSDDWSLVLDMYAGSGALGIEALSRGAGEVDFVEQNARCCAIIRDNLKRIQLEDRAHVYCWSAENAISRLNKEYSVILMDPPYSQSLLKGAPEKLFSSPLVGPDSTVVVQHSCHQTLMADTGCIKLVRTRNYGDTCISIYRRGDSL